jgi:hypothetical protein
MLLSVAHKTIAMLHNCIKYGNLIHTALCVWITNINMPANALLQQQLMVPIAAPNL